MIIDKATKLALKIAKHKDVEEVYMITNCYIKPVGRTNQSVSLCFRPKDGTDQWLHSTDHSASEFIDKVEEVANV